MRRVTHWTLSQKMTNGTMFFFSKQEILCLNNLWQSEYVPDRLSDNTCH